MALNIWGEKQKEQQEKIADLECRLKYLEEKHDDVILRVLAEAGELQMAAQHMFKDRFKWHGDERQRYNGREFIPTTEYWGSFENLNAAVTARKLADYEKCKAKKKCK